MSIGQEIPHRFGHNGRGRTSVDVGRHDFHVCLELLTVAGEPTDEQSNLGSVVLGMRFISFGICRFLFTTFSETDEFLPNAGRSFHKSWKPWPCATKSWRT